MWHKSPEASAVLAAINPADLLIVRRTLPVGEGHWAWSTDNEAGDALNALLTAAVDAQTGTTSKDPVRYDEWFAAAFAMKSVSDVLNDKFGDPNDFAAVWGFYGNPTMDARHRMNEVWQAECARAAAVRRAA